MINRRGKKKSIKGGEGEKTKVEVVGERKNTKLGERKSLKNKERKIKEQERRQRAREKAVKTITVEKR